MKIVIVDYGMGNVKSIDSTLKHLGVHNVQLSSDYENLKSADKIILPGVGSYGEAMSRIRERKIDVYLNDIVVENKKPLLGICLGMQILGFSSTEDGLNEGLGFVKASAIKFDNSKVNVPHVGFNQVRVDSKLKLYKGFTVDTDFYFTHSYKMSSEHQINQCYCHYENDFIASFECENITGVQFHPELSQNNGLKLLKNFIENF